MLWKTKRSLEACGRRGKLIHYQCGNLSWLLDGDEKLVKYPLAEARGISSRFSAFGGFDACYSVGPFQPW